MSIKEIVMKLGLVPEETLDELSRWRLLEKQRPDPFLVNLPPEVMAQKIAEAREGEDEVGLKETDPDIYLRYGATKHEAKLCLKDMDSKDSASFGVSVGLSAMGEYIIPWDGDDISDILTNGTSYLLDKGEQYFFNSVSELWFGGKKTFILCHISCCISDPKEAPDGAG